MDIKLKNNNRNNGAGNNNVSANNDASSNSGASRNNGAGNSSNNSNAVNSSKRIIIAIAGIIFITIITMCFFPVVYRTAERQKEQQKAEMMRESSDSVDNDTVQTLYQGSYVLYVEQMERSGQADAGGLFLNLPTDDEDYQYVKDTVTSTFDEWKSQFESDSWNIDYCVYKSSADCVKNTDQPLETCVDGTVTEKIKQYYTDIVCLSFDKEGALEVTPLYDENISGSVLIKAFQNVDRENLLGQSLGGYVEAGQLQGPKDFKVIFGLPVSTSDTISLGDPYGDMANYWTQVVLVYRASGGSILLLVSLAAVAGWMFLMTSRRIWNEDIPMQRPGKWYGGKLLRYHKKLFLLQRRSGCFTWKQCLESRLTAWTDDGSAPVFVWHLVRGASRTASGIFHGSQGIYQTVQPDLSDFSGVEKIVEHVPL